MSNAIDRTGERHGRWTVVSRAENSKSGRCRWWCVCDCGTERAVLGASLSRSHSCGCWNNEQRSRRMKAWNAGEAPEESWTTDGAGWAVPQIALDWIRRPIRREAA